MNKISNIIVASSSIIIVLIVGFWFLRDNLKSGKDNEQTFQVQVCDYRTYVDSVSGIIFDYNKDWIVEKHKRNSDDWYIIAHAPFEKEYLKFVMITIVPVQDLDMAVKEWWIENYERLNVEENKIYFQHPKTHRYQGITYSSNRAQFRDSTSSGVCAMDYHVMAFQKKMKTILLVEEAERGGMDGFEADGFIRIEKTIDIIR